MKERFLIVFAVENGGIDRRGSGAAEPHVAGNLSLPWRGDGLCVVPRCPPTPQGTPPLHGRVHVYCDFTSSLQYTFVVLLQLHFDTNSS